MDRDKILQEIEETKKHLEELERLAKEEERKGTWKPKKDERYYYINGSGVVGTYKNNGDQTDTSIINVGNCFKTREEAELEVEKRKVIHELKQFAYEFSDEAWHDVNINKYFLQYNDTICIVYNIGNKHNDIYFKSEKDAKEAIESVGEDRIKKYYFRVGDQFEEIS